MNVDNADVCPAGLTCASCKEPFRGTVSRCTEEGFVHVVCPPATLRQCSVEGCTKNQHAYGYCHKHGRSFLKHGDPLTSERSRTHLEDVLWMVETGETWEGAVARLGVQPGTLQRLLLRDAPDAYARLRRNEAAS